MNPYSVLLDEYGLIELAGEDRREWLQGQVTGDVAKLEAGEHRSFCFVEPTGGILAAVDAWALPDRFLMMTARERIPAVLDRIERMTILEDVVAKEVAAVGLSVLERVEIDGLVLPTHRFGREGWDLWASPEAIDGLKRVFPPLGTEAAEALRLESGLPRWGVDMGSKTLPPELGAEFERRHVDYDKGCYTGQEVLMRLHSRGHTNRTWVGLVAEKRLIVGESVLHEGRTVGTVSSIAESSVLGAIAAATLRNEATEAGARVVIGGVEAEVRPMPLLRRA